MTDPIVWKCGGCCAFFLLFLFIILISSSVQQVDRLHVGLLKNGVTGEVDLTGVYNPGRYMVGFHRQFLQAPTTLNTIEFSQDAPEEGVQDLDRLKARDQDGKAIYMDISIQYRIIPEKFPQIYKDMTVLYEDIFISDLRSGLQRASNKFQIGEAWKNYSRVQQIMKDECVATLNRKNAECWDLQFWGVRLADKYEDQLIRTQVQKERNIKEQKRQLHADYRAKTNVIIADYDRQKTVIEAGAAAQKVDIERLARSEAEELLVKAHSEVLQLIRETVVLPNASGTGNITMNHTELLQYQRILMLQNMKSSNFALKSKGGGMQRLETI